MVLVRLVKIPVLGVMLPIWVLLMRPPAIVRVSTTIASVIELFGKVTCPVAFKLVVVAFTIVMFVPFAVVKVRPAILVTPEM